MKPESSHLLVVDDNRVNRMKLSRSLEQQAHSVAIAENGLQALEMLNGEKKKLPLLVRCPYSRKPNELKPLASSRSCWWVWDIGFTLQSLSARVRRRRRSVLRPAKLGESIG